MKNVIVKILVFSMLLTLLPNIQYVKADTGIQDKVTSVDVGKVESEVNKELGIEVSNELKINIEKETDEKVVVNTTLDTTDLSVSTDIDMKLETGGITVFGKTVDENGEETQQNFDVYVQEVEGNDFIATFVDQETGKEYEVNTLKASASIWPVVVAAVARYGIQYAIKKYGKQAVTSAMKQVPKSINKVDDKFLKRKGIDAHELKRDYLGRSVSISKYDIYVDKKTGRLWIYLKGGKGTPIPTDSFIK